MTAGEYIQQEWLKEGQRRLLLRQFGVRFGAAPDKVRARLNAAAPDLLETWAERLLTASSLEEIFGDA